MTPPRPAVWVTRAEPGASETAGRLLALGLEPVIAPVIRTVPIPLEDDGFDPSLPLVFTSRTAVQLFAELTPIRTARVFAVGEATAEGARASGWTHVASADGDVRAVAEMIRTDGGVRRLLHPSAEMPAGDLEGLLAPAGIALDPLVLYRTEFVGELPPAAAMALERGALSAVLVHSPSAGRALARLLAGSSRRDMPVFALSDACARPIPATLFREIVVSPFPREAALLKVVTDRLFGP